MLYHNKLIELTYGYIKKDVDVLLLAIQSPINSII